MAAQASLNAIYFSTALRQKLDDIASASVTTVIAPMGYGKTTAITAFYKQLKGKALLFRENVIDRDTTSFWQGFCSAFRARGDLSRKLGGLGLPVSAVEKRIFIDLLVDEFEQVGQEAYLFIDDFHMVTDDKVRGFIFFWCRQLPENLHLIISSRGRIFTEAERIALGANLNEITVQHLKFGRDDVARYARACGIRLAQAQLDQLYNASEGWISAIYLNLNAYAGSGQLLAEQKNIYHMINQVLFETLDEETQCFLTTLCITDAFTLEQARLLSGNAQVEDLLQRVLDHNAFIIHLAGSDSYRIHYMLRECLWHYFQKLPAPKQEQVWERQGEWAASQGQFVEAMRLFLKTRNYRRLMEIVEADVGRSTTYEYREFVARCTQEIPETILLRYPFGLLVLMRKFFNFRLIPQMMRMGQLFLIALKQAQLPREEKDNMVGEYELIQSFLKYNDIEKMSQHHRKAAALMTRPTRTTDTTFTWTFGAPSILEMFHRESGHLDEELAQMQGALPYYYKVTGNHGYGVAKLMEAEIAYMRGHFDQAEICMCQAKRQAQEWNQYGILTDVLLLEMQLLFIKGDWESIGYTLLEYRTFLEEHRQYLLLHTWDICTARVELLKGQLEFVPEWIAQGNLQESVLSHPALPMLHVTYNEVLLARGAYPALLARGEVCEKLNAVYPNCLCEIELQIQLAKGYLALDERAHAQVHLRKALDLALPDRLYMPFATGKTQFFDMLMELAPQYPEDALEQINALAAQVRVAREKGSTQQPSRLHAYGLTKREREIAYLAAQRRSNKEIAQTLYLTENTVKTHLKHVFEKLGIQDARGNKRRLLEQLMK